MILCNHAELLQVKKEFRIDGDPTEGALLVAAMKAGYNREQLLNEFKMVREFPFDSTRKMMSVIIQDANGRQFVVTKGAPDVLIGKSEDILWDGKKRRFSTETKETVQSAINELASQALRTIAIGFKEIAASTVILDEKEAEKDLTFIGLLGMIDPPRPEVKQAVKECKEAGIKTVMITGDHVITARAIAKQLGILTNQSKVLDGNALSEMSVDELEEIVDGCFCICSCFSRT